MVSTSYKEIYMVQGKDNERYTISVDYDKPRKSYYLNVLHETLEYHDGYTMASIEVFDKTNMTMLLKYDIQRNSQSLFNYMVEELHAYVPLIKKNLKNQRIVLEDTPCRTIEK